MADTNITDKHKAEFEALTSGRYRNFALVSCFIDGEPTCAIASVNEDGGEYLISPLFVAVTDKMKLTDHDGREPTGG